MLPKARQPLTYLLLGVLCLSLFSATDALSLRQRRYNAIGAIFNGLLQVNANATQNGVIPYPDIFTDNVRFKTRGLLADGDLNLANEYLFGLTANVFFGASSADYVLEDFIMDGDKAFMRAVLLYKYPNGTNVANITIPGSYRFDTHPHNRSRIIEFELYPLELRKFWDALGLDITQQYWRDALKFGVCQIHDQYCTGALQQYSDFNDCFAQLSAKEFGDPGDMESDTVVCRNLHGNMVKINAAHHCPHIGPTGGGRCFHMTQSQADAPVFHTNPRLIY